VVQITGIFNKCSKPKSQALINAEPLFTLDQTQLVDVLTLPLKPAKATGDIEKNKKQKNLEQAKLAFGSELGSITAQFARGIAAQIGFDTSCRITNRSRASACRDIAKSILPAPIKVEGRSFFKHSVMLAYTAGK